MTGVFLGVLVFFPFLGGLLAAVAGKKHADYRDFLADIVVVFEFLTAFGLFSIQSFVGEATFAIDGICGMGLHFQAGGFRLIYALVAAFMWLMTTLLSREYCRGHANTNRFYLFLLLTLGATMGVFLSADLFTTFIFFELMSFTSYVWVAQEETAPALRAGQTYLAIAELRAHAADADARLLYTAGGCLLVGFGAKAGAFPLHIWLPKAHPVAPAPASALLSGILTKAGIYGVLILSAQLFFGDPVWGALLLGIGVLTMFGGALLAVCSIDLKRTLACSSMSQIGFILIGIGMQGLLVEGRELAVHGTLLHMVNHSMIKLVLFMAAGVIFMNTHALDLNAIRGYGRNKPLLKVIFGTGALAIAGVPLFGGYISKTLLHESIVEYGGGWQMKAVEWIFLLSGGLTVAYMTKLFVAIFIEKNDQKDVQGQFDAQKHYMNAGSTFALAGSALVLLVWGLLPHGLMDRAAAMGQAFMGLEETGHRVSYFSLTNLSGALISIGIGTAVYLLVIRKALMDQAGRYINVWPVWLDLENLIYRPVLRLLILLAAICCRVLDCLVDFLVVLLRRSIYRDSPLPHELPEGNVLTVAAGKTANVFGWLGNHTWRRKHPVERDYVHVLAVRYEELKENNMVIGRSLSFALLLLCIGFLLTLFYLIWW